MRSNQTKEVVGNLRERSRAVLTVKYQLQSRARAPKKSLADAQSQLAQLELQKTKLWRIRIQLILKILLIRWEIEEKRKISYIILGYKAKCWSK